MPAYKQAAATNSNTDPVQFPAVSKASPIRLGF